MKASSSWVLACLLLLLPILGACDKEIEDLKAMDRAWDRAVDDGDGQKAASFLSKASIAHMDTLLTHARKSSRKQVEALCYSDRFDVLAMRLIMTQSELSRATGWESYVHLVNDGLVWSTTYYKRTRYSVDADRPQARVTYQVPFTKETFNSHFIKEDGKWKGDFVSNVAEINKMAKARAKELNITENQLLIQTLEEAWETEVPDSIWNAGAVNR